MRTQKDNLVEIRKLIEFFGADYPIEAIEPINVRQYMTWRISAPIRATREKALLSHMFNMAREWGLTNKPNPCAGIKGTSSQRDVYIEDDVYQAVYGCADRALKDALDLAYLCAQRPADTLKMSETDIQAGQIHIQQGAGRPKVEEPAKTRTIKLTDADWERFKEIGGAKWLRIQLATENSHGD